MLTRFACSRLLGKSLKGFVGDTEANVSEKEKGSECESSLRN